MVALVSPRLAGLVLVVASTLVACGGNDSSPTTAGTAADLPAADRPADDPPAPAADEDAGILDVEATTVSGDVVDLGRYAGSDLALWFWAPW